MNDLAILMPSIPRPSLVVRIACAAATATILGGCSMMPQATTVEKRGEALQVYAGSESVMLPPGCVGLLARSPNGDALVEAVRLSGKGGCLASAAFPRSLTTLDDGWVRATYIGSNQTFAYRARETTRANLFRLTVQSNYGGSFTSTEFICVLFSKARHGEPGLVVSAIRRSTDQAMEC